MWNTSSLELFNSTSRPRLPNHFLRNLSSVPLHALATQLQIGLMHFPLHPGVARRALNLMATRCRQNFCLLVENQTLSRQQDGASAWFVKLFQQSLVFIVFTQMVEISTAAAMAIIIMMCHLEIYRLKSRWLTPAISCVIILKKQLKQVSNYVQILLWCWL